MNRKDLLPEEYDRLLEKIASLILKRGLKATTMDSVASHLSMSKRTLYEIFESKNNMAFEALKHVHDINIRRMKRLFESSPTVLHGWIEIIKAHREMINRMSADFFRDMDFYHTELVSRYRQMEDDRHQEMERMCLRGVEQGVFRPDLNYGIQSRIFDVQMESLKRMEELFPPGITATEVYDSICLGFLRSIVTPQGMEMLEGIG